MPSVRGYIFRSRQAPRGEQVEQVLAVGKLAERSGEGSDRPGRRWGRSPGRRGGGRGGRTRDRVGPGIALGGGRTRGSPPCRRAGRRGSSRRSPRTVSRTFRRPKATLTTPNVSLGTGSRWVSPSTRVTRPDAPALRTLARPRRSISRQKSAPTIGDRPPAGAVVCQGQVGRPGAAVEHRDARLGRDHPGRESPPRTIDVQAQQVVEEIVPAARSRRTSAGPAGPTCRCDGCQPRRTRVVP